ncbi:hypothetical protein GCM10011611_37820 [Aliidongia dinghuensis]|uniref:DUF2239 family protein n=1 Tax=Aliidongia dinghuensis TaxID=1867774 RepID=A0A8J3E4L2_9PROT|nr:DUF2239 family protein [Aliidongia dinghuensis]GGF28226.1 hypothetical protein GCM10011611_37820 [Aliidongia dinghuensis]
MIEISPEPASPTATAFDGPRRIASGPLVAVALAVKAAIAAGAAGPVLTFDDRTGRVIDLDLRGSDAEIAARLGDASPARGRGRPKLGVTAREVTLLPRHWEWLAAQPGGASVTLRRLVDQARRADGDDSRLRAAREAAYRFMAAMAGDLPGFEEAARALFADDWAGLERHGAGWPADVRAYMLKLADGSPQ